jgi:hypothetical protein
MDHRGPSRIAVACYAPPGAFGPGCRSGLESLGYRLLGGRPLAVALRSDGFRPAIRVVDERLLGRVPEDPEGVRVPIILLTGRHPGRTSDPRVIGRTARPAKLALVYALLQRALEATPRRVPRVRAALPARAVCGAAGWAGAIVSLSEEGCLMRGRATATVTRPLDLWFALPEEGLIHVVAEASYQDRGHTGLVFREPSEDSRAAIADYVSQVLAAG